MSSNVLTEDGKNALMELNRLVRKPLVVKEKGFFVKTFFPKRMTVSFFNTIQVPEGRQITDITVFHEFQHYLDRCYLEDGEYKTNTLRSIWWYFKYLCPTILVMFSLLTLLAIPFSNWFLLSLVFLIFTPPITPLSGFRRNAEIRGYFWTSMFRTGVDYRGIFSGIGYYKMDSRKGNVYYLRLFSGMVDENVYDPNDNMSDIYKVYTEFMINKDQR